QRPAHGARHAGAAHDAAPGERLRAGARPVRTARARLPRLRQVAQGADLRPREQPPRERALPPRQPRAAARAPAALGRGEGGPGRPAGGNPAPGPGGPAPPRVAETRRDVLRVLGGSALALAVGPRSAFAADRAYGIAFTSFAVRLQR